MPSVLPSPEEIPLLVPQPGGPVWRAANDIRTMSTAGYALILQVAHPTVGAGVGQHSNFAADPWSRLLRTLDYVNGTIYGGPDLAAEIGRRVRGMHRSIKGVRPDGERYHALEPAAYALGARDARQRGRRWPQALRAPDAPPPEGGVLGRVA